MVSDLKPEQIGSLLFRNPNGVKVLSVNFEKNPAVFKLDDGGKVSNCECMLVSEQGNKKRWLALAELKYCKGEDRNIASNFEDAVEVLTGSKDPKDYLKKMRKRDPELSINQAVQDWRRLGYSENWINNRIKSIEVRKGLTDEWDRAGVQQGQQYASLTDIITREWSGKTTRPHRARGLSPVAERNGGTRVPSENSRTVEPPTDNWKVASKREQCRARMSIAERKPARRSQRGE